MYLVVDETTRKIIPLKNAKFEVMCPDCGKYHTFDPLELAAEDPEFNFADCKVYCDDCWEKHKELNL